MEDPELKKILEEHTTQATKDKIAGIDRNEKSYWDKLQMGMIIAAIVIAVVAVVAVAVYLYKRHKKKEAQKKAEKLLQETPNQNTGNSPTPIQSVAYDASKKTINNQSKYNLKTVSKEQERDLG